MRTSRRCLLSLGLLAACQAGDADPEPVVAEAELASTAPPDGDDGLPDDLEPLAGCNGSPASFQVKAASPVGGPLVGFGAQFNSYLFHPVGRFNQARVGALAEKLRELRPQHVRIFFTSKALRDPALLTSFSRTVALAQSAGATINVTWWHGPYKGTPGTAGFGKEEMEQFADVLEDELAAGHTSIKYVTVQNEPNRTKFNSHKKDLLQLYKNLDSALEARGIRSRLSVVWEITRGYPGTKSWFKDWLKVIGPGAPGVIDAYAFHIYWDHDMWDVVRDRRIKEIKDAMAALPAAQRRPVFVTEFGTRGEPDANKSALPWPGWQKAKCTAGKAGCRRILDTTEAGVNNAWFQVVGARAGFRAFVYWDAYWTMYGKTEQHWSMIGKTLAARPTYHVQRLFSHVVPTGWHAVSVSGPTRQHLRSTAFRGGSDLAVVGVNKSSCDTTFRYSGLPAGKKMFVLVWNDDGSGTICSRGLKTATGGAMSVPIHARSVIALTTRAPGLQVPACGARGTSGGGGGDDPVCGDGECTDGETDATCGQDCGCAADSCGSVAPFGCYCDATCSETGDCCADLGVCQ
jgi:hypothetical protein